MLPTLIVAGGIFIASTSTSHGMELPTREQPTYDEGKDDR